MHVLKWQVRKRERTARRMGRRMQRKETEAKPLPRWFLVLGYLTCFLWILFCGLYTVAVAIKFKPHMATTWFTSCITSVSWEALIQDPTKILIALIIAENADAFVKCYYNCVDYMPIEVVALSNWVDDRANPKNRIAKKRPN